MAEIRVTDEGGGAGLPPTGPADDRTLPGEITASRNLGVTHPDHLLSEHTGAVAPGMIAAVDDPDTVREEIERTRARMSSTIDSIEEALLRKKERIEEKLDVFAPVRERPLLYAGGVFAAGLLLGYLTGGGGDDGERAPRARGLGVDADLDGEEAYGEDWRTRAGQWEKRARTLMKTCSRQEEELRSLRASLAEPYEGDGPLSRVGGAVADWRDGLAAGLTGFVANLLHRGSRREEDGVEVEVAVEPTAGDGYDGYYQRELAQPL
jgi:uncharacterized protein DUF3618